MKKRNLILLTTLLLTFVSAVPTYAGWDKDEKGYWYLFDSGSYARSQIVAIDGVNYAFNQDAYMVEGWYQDNNSKWYYFTPGSGAQAYGWQQIGGVWYYLNPDNGGIMQTSWLSLGNKRYYFDENGVMKTGPFVVGGFYYLAEQDGNIRRNTLEKEGNITIRYDEEGKQWYKNAESAINSMNGGESWLPLLDDAALMIQREEIQQSNADYIVEVQDELNEAFEQEMSTASGYKNREKRIEKWKEKATRKLKELALSDEEINTYINSVLSYRYGEEEEYDDYEEYDEYDYEYYFGED